MNDLMLELSVILCHTHWKPSDSTADRMAAYSGLDNYNMDTYGKQVKATQTSIFIHYTSICNCYRVNSYPLHTALVKIIKCLKTDIIKLNELNHHSESFK